MNDKEVMPTSEECKKLFELIRSLPENLSKIKLSTMNFKDKEDDRA